MQRSTIGAGVVTLCHPSMAALQRWCVLFVQRWLVAASRGLITYLCGVTSLWSLERWWSLEHSKHMKSPPSGKQYISENNNLFCYLALHVAPLLSRLWKGGLLIELVGLETCMLLLSGLSLALPTYNPWGEADLL